MIPLTQTILLLDLLSLQCELTQLNSTQLFFSLLPLDYQILHSSTNLTELAKAVKLLAALSTSDLEGDDLLKAARALAAATAALLNAAQPENMDVSGL